MIEQNKKTRRLNRVRNKIAQNLGIPRLSVFRSNQHIWAQIIDDKHGKTLVSASTKTVKNLKGTKSEKATVVGQSLAKLALDKKLLKLDLIGVATATMAESKLWLTAPDQEV